MQLPSTSKSTSVLYQGLDFKFSTLKSFLTLKIITIKYLPLLTEEKTQGLEKWKGCEASVGGAECSKDKGQKPKTTTTTTKKAEPRTCVKDPYKVFLISGPRSFSWIPSQTTSPVSLICRTFQEWILSTSAIVYIFCCQSLCSSVSLKFKEYMQSETQDWHILNVQRNKPSVLWMDMWMRQWVNGKSREGGCLSPCMASHSGILVFSSLYQIG